MSSLTKKMLLTVAALIAICSGVLGVTYASFTASPVVVTANVVASGSLALSRTDAGSVVFSMTNAKIGGPEATGSLTIKNDGTLGGIFSLTAASTGDTSTLGAQAHVVIYTDTDGTGTKTYDGALNALTTLALGTIAPAASHTYFFHVTLPTAGSDATDNLIQGKSVSTTLTWNATQA